MKTIGSLLLLTFLILGFQNCSNGANFTSAGELVAKNDDSNSDLTPGDGSITPPNNGDGGGGVVAPPPGGDDDDDTTPPGSGTTPPPTGGKKKRETSCNSGRGDNDNPEHDDTLAYTCVLKSSAKINLVGLQAKGGGKIRNVCMSENACLKILNTKFEVRRAEKNSACPGNNSSAISMSDADIKASLAEAELIQSLSTSRY